jgi:hypothetical protein
VFSTEVETASHLEKPVILLWTRDFHAVCAGPVGRGLDGEQIG